MVVDRVPRSSPQRRPAANPVLAAVLATLAAVSGCAEGYCQSGPKYGMQCYSINELEWQEAQVRGERREQAAVSPGCVLATPGGFVQQPLPTGGGGVSMQPATAAPYLMSGACAPTRRSVPGPFR
jgi:hypothetical protein